MFRVFYIKVDDGTWYTLSLASGHTGFYVAEGRGPQVDPRGVESLTGHTLTLQKGRPMVLQGDEGIVLQTRRVEEVEESD